jgi:membrane protein insertase Oxa1/YidC/SpoIIIJ
LIKTEDTLKGKPMNNSLVSVTCPVCGQTAYTASALYQLGTSTEHRQSINSSGTQYDQKIVQQSYLAEKLPPPKNPVDMSGCGWFLLFAALGYIVNSQIVVHVKIFQQFGILPLIILCIVLPSLLIRLIAKIKRSGKKQKILEKELEERTEKYKNLYVCTAGTHLIYVWSETNRQIVVELEKAKELYS